MKDHVFTDSNKKLIPSMDLLHEGIKTEFAMRTMESIYDRTNGAADVPHRHAYYTVLWVKQGSGAHTIDYREHELAANRVFFVSPGQVHQVVTRSRPHGVAIMFTCNFLAKNHISHDFITNLGLFSELPDTPPIVTSPELNDRLEIYTSQMAKAFEQSEPFKVETIGAWLKLFLIECNKAVVANPMLNPQAIQSGRFMLFEFKQLVETRFREWHKVSDYSTQLSITPDYLNNVVKSHIGVTAKEFIQNRIVIEAKRLGVITELTSKEIAFSLGFDDPAHFSKFFKNVSGASFSDFRNELQLQLAVK
jgi:AraC family transcriptional regulator, transcriptional activator of pobA